MRLVLPLLATTLLAASPAQDGEDRGPGLVARRDGAAWLYPAHGFDRIALAGAARMDVRVGPNFAVRATGFDAALAKLRVTVDEGGLKIEPRYRNYSLTERERALAQQLRFTVTLPRLAAVALAGSGGMAIDRVEGGDFAAAVAGSGDLAIGRLAVSSAKVTIGGSGSVTATGRARRLNVIVGGSGRLDAPGLRADEASVMSAGSGSVRADVAGSASVRTVGSGWVDLGTGARCNVSRMGAGTVRCGG